MTKKTINEELVNRLLPGEKGSNIRKTNQPDIYNQEVEIVFEFMHLINQPDGLHGLLHSITHLMHKWSGCKAVGIRLKDGDDYPYFETSGFPPEFVKAESSLCALDINKNTVRDSKGNPVLECMCGNIICGRFDPQLPFFTAQGSFWTNSTTKLLASSTENERQARTRNRCHGEGFESVALIPIKHGSETLGLLQFNDTMQDMFTLEKISFLERLASNLAIMIKEQLTSKALRESQQKLNQLNQLLSSILDHTHIMTVYLDPQFNFVWVNHAYAATCGYEQSFFVGKNHFDLYPHGENQTIFQEVVNSV